MTGCSQLYFYSNMHKFLFLLPRFLTFTAINSFLSRQLHLFALITNKQFPFIEFLPFLMSFFISNLTHHFSNNGPVFVFFIFQLFIVYLSQFSIIRHIFSLPSKPMLGWVFSHLKNYLKMLWCLCFFAYSFVAVISLVAYSFLHIAVFLNAMTHASA